MTQRTLLLAAGRQLIHPSPIYTHTHKPSQQSHNEDQNQQALVLYTRSRTRRPDTPLLSRLAPRPYSSSATRKTVGSPPQPSSPSEDPPAPSSNVTSPSVRPAQNTCSSSNKHDDATNDNGPSQSKLFDKTFDEDPFHNASSSALPSHYQDIYEPLTDEYKRVILSRRKYRAITPPWPSLLPNSDVSYDGELGEGVKKREDPVKQRKKIIQALYKHNRQAIRSGSEESSQDVFQKSSLAAERKTITQSIIEDSTASSTKEPQPNKSQSLKTPQFKPNTTHKRDRRLSRPGQSDIIVHLLQQGDYDVAQRLRDELVQARTRITFHRVYLETAIDVLRKGAGVVSDGSGGASGGANNRATTTLKQKEEAKEQALQWLRYWHSFSASEHIPSAVGRQLEPLVSIVIDSYGSSHNPTDIDFIRSLLRLSAKKAFVPVLIPTLFRHLTFLLPPADSFALITELITLFRASPRQHMLPNGRIARARFLDGRKKAIVNQARFWRNLHLRTVLDAGHIQDGKAIFESGLSIGVEWSDRTKAQMIHALTNERQLADVGKGWEEGKKTLKDVMNTDLEVGEKGKKMLDKYKSRDSKRNILTEEGTNVKQMILQAAHAGMRQPTGQMVEILDALEQLERYSLIQRLQGRFVAAAPHNTQSRRSKHRVSSASSDSSWQSDKTASYWWLVQILRLQARHQHKEAVQLFADRFRWIGLPDVGIRASPRSLPTIYPSKQVVTGILPSILRQITDLNLDQLWAIHKNLMDRSKSLPPSVQPDVLTHLVFIKVCARQINSQAAQDLADRFIASGIEIGVQGHAALATAWAQEKNMKRVWMTLAKIRNSVAPGPGQLVNPVEVEGLFKRMKAGQPDLNRAYLGVATTLIRKKDHSAAKSVLKAMKRHQGKVASILHSTIGETTRNGVGSAVEKNDEDIQELRKAVAGSLKI